MLKIRDDVDLKELEKYGFSYTNENEIFMSTYKSNDTPFDISEMIFEVDSDRKIIYRLQNYSMYCNSLEELESDYKEITKNYEKFKKITNDLIKNDLVEKVKE